MCFTCFIRSFRISVRNNSCKNNQMLNFHGVSQGNICGDNHVGDLCYHHYFIGDAEAEKD